MTKGDIAAQKAIDFINELKHTKGKWAGTKFNLRDWQINDIIKPIFGTLNHDEKRKIRTVYVALPRKNGKSEIAAGIGLYLLFADGEMGAEIYVAAGDRDQASLVFNVAAQMVRMSPDLSGNCKIIDSQKRIVRHERGSFLRAISAEAYTKFGFNASGIIFDELHVQPNRELWDTLTTSTGAREQPLTFAITTAGFDVNSLCWEIHEYADSVARGVIKDETFLPVIYSAPRDADWKDESVWHDCNPALGDFRGIEEMREFCNRAKHVPALENTFRRLYLNQWVSQETRWLPMDYWDACSHPVSARKLLGHKCYGGLDLATEHDLAAFVLVFPHEDDTFSVLPYFWTPKQNLAKRSDRYREQIDLWSRQGYITATPGRTINYKFIIRQIQELSLKYDLREIAYDRWGASKIRDDIIDMGYEDEGAKHAPRHLIEFGQGYKSMSPPTKELLNLVLEKRIKHGGHPVLRWNADNLVIRKDPAENVKPDKEKSTERIDGVVALLMGLDRALRSQLQPSIYEPDGPRAGKLISLWDDDENNPR